MDLISVAEFLKKSGQPDFRFRQLVKNYYSGRFKDYASMLDLPLPLRQELTSNYPYLSVAEVKTLEDKTTQKALLSLHDGLKIETVLMDYDSWQTACISTQVGCALGCTFCATGKMGFRRNLTVSEIVDQVLFWNQKLFPQYIGRIVFMGMGEPFLNWENLAAALEIINSKDGLNIGSRKISISTAGVALGIKTFADFDSEINLAISLHSANQTTRQSIMPIARQFPLSSLLESLDYYTTKTRRQVFFEYALISHVNDTPSELKALINFLKSNRLFYLNLIPLNPVKGGLIPSTQGDFNRFVEGLNHARVDYSIRRTFGQTINSACGQLSAEIE